MSTAAMFHEGKVSFSEYSCAVIACLMESTRSFDATLTHLSRYTNPVPSKAMLCRIASHFSIRMPSEAVSKSPKPLKKSAEVARFLTPQREKKIVHFFKALQSQQGQGPDRWAGPKARKVLAEMVRHLNVVKTRRFLKSHGIIPPSAPTLSRIAEEYGIDLQRGRPSKAA